MVRRISTGLDWAMDESLYTESISVVYVTGATKNQKTF